LKYGKKTNEAFRFSRRKGDKNAYTVNMLRVTEAQAHLFTQRANGARGHHSKQRVKKRREDLPENIVTKQIKDFLEVKGWIVERMHSGLFNRRYGPGKEPAQPAMVRIGSKGRADWTAYRRTSGILFHLFHLEIKAPGKTPKPDQILWLDRHNATGTPAAYFDGFDTGRKPFVAWYRQHFEPSLPLTMFEQAETDW
jgi:hypothetical protein